MPKVLKALGFIGMIAMLMVGGGILMHNLPFLHGLANVGRELPSILPQFMEYFSIPIAFAVTTGASLVLFKNLVNKYN